jgi:hypothetical protein
MINGQILLLRVHFQRNNNIIPQPKTMKDVAVLCGNFWPFVNLTFCKPDVSDVLKPQTRHFETWRFEIWRFVSVPDKHLAQSPFTDQNFFYITTFGIAFYESNLATAYTQGRATLTGFAGFQWVTDSLTSPRPPVGEVTKEHHHDQCNLI